MGRIVTFYSFKGGVGRSMGLANIAVLLARRGRRVLVVDWDLEAPGLERYFDYFELSIKRGGLLPFLVEQHARLAADGIGHAEQYRDHLSMIDVGTGTVLAFLGSGKSTYSDYARTLEQFAWPAFFARGGGDFLERLRDSWRREFDFVLIDSRTGLSDAGGICTIQMPDVLVPMFTPNYQSLLGVRDVIAAAQAGRQRLAYDRMALSVLPIPSRFPTTATLEMSRQWLQRFSTELGEFTVSWLPRGVDPSAVFERLIIPQRDEYGIGERLPVVEGTDGDLLAAAYERIAVFLASDLQRVEDALGQLTPHRDAVPNSMREPSRDGVFDVFVSYPHNVGSVLREWILQLVEMTKQELAVLIGREPRFWLDVNEIYPGDEIMHRVGEGLDRSRVMLAMVSPHYSVSPSCMSEWQAFEVREATHQRTLIAPVQLRGTQSVPTRFHDRQFVVGTMPGPASMEATPENTWAIATAIARALEDLLRDAPEPGETQPVVARHGSGEPTVLFLPANSVGTGSLELEVEARELGRVFDADPAFMFKLRRPQNPEDLLHEVRATHPSVIHFSGHGSNDGLYLQGPDGLPELLSERAIGGVFDKIKGVKLVVLNACYSDQQAQALGRHVDCVVGIGPSISDGAARAFSSGLYRGLLNGQSVQASLDQASSQMAFESPGLTESPRLVTREGVDASQLFLTEFQAHPKD